MYTVVDLFAGAGGLSLGFMQTQKYDIKVAFENSPYMQDTYRRNHPGVEVVCLVALLKIAVFVLTEPLVVFVTIVDLDDLVTQQTPLALPDFFCSQKFLPDWLDKKG